MENILGTGEHFVITKNGVSQNIDESFVCAARVVSVSENLTNQTTSIAAGQSETVIYVNSGSTTDYTVAVSSTYITPDGQPIELTCPKGGYCEVSYINISGTIYARGL